MLIHCCYIMINVLKIMICNYIIFNARLEYECNSLSRYVRLLSWIQVSCMQDDIKKGIMKS